MHWETTGLGILTISFAIAGYAIGKLDWPATLAAITAGIGLIRAADSNKTGG
mgnify:CR=1 FL=1